MTQPRCYLACVVIRHDTVIVHNSPLQETEVVIPSLSAQDSRLFETLRIRTDGSVVRDSTSQGCILTSVPMMYPCVSQSAQHGDMELEEGPAICVNNGGSVRVYRTIPYPDKKNRSLVVLSGILITTGSEGPLCVLPEFFRPHAEMSFVCNLAGDYVTVYPDGRVSCNRGSSEMSLDNVRFFSGEDSSEGDIKSRFPYRSVISIMELGKPGAIAGKYSDLYFPITLETTCSSEIVESGVAVLTESGSLCVLSASGSHGKVVSGPVLVSSLITCAVPNANRSAAKLVASLQDEQWTEFKDLVGQKLSTLIYSELTGDPVLKCDNRDRSWRQSVPSK